MASTYGVNGPGIRDIPNDLFKTAQIITQDQAGWHIIAHPCVTVSGAVSYVDASTAMLTDAGKPTAFPPDDLFFTLGASFPPWRRGTYDVTFTPGLRWTVTGNGAGTRTAYDEMAGTATIEITGDTVAGNFLIYWTGYDDGGGYVARTLPPAASLYFRMFKQGDDTTKLVSQQFKDDLAPFAGGFIRLMSATQTNRPAVTGVTYNTVMAAQLSRIDTVTWNLTFGSGPPLEALIEIAEDCGMMPWFNIKDSWSDEAVTAYAQRIAAALPADMPFGMEYTNEAWNFSGGFTQSTAINDRATAAGVTNAIQYARELKQKITLFEAVFPADARLRPIMAWQSVAATSTWTGMLNEGDLYQDLYGVAIAPYGGGGIGGIDVGNYSATTAFSTADRDLILTDPAAFKTAAFAALSDGLEAVNAAWYGFVDMLRDYCASKGLARTILRPMTYEHAAQHIVERNTPTASDQHLLTRTAFAEMLREASMADLTIHQAARLMDVGADLCHFDLSSNAVGSSLVFGIWGLMDAAGDVTDEPYASLADFLLNPAARNGASAGVLRL